MSTSTSSTTSTDLELPIRGTITSWQPEDSIGRIRLSSGEEIRFGHSACVNMRPALGAEVWVVEVAPHPLGGLRAKVLNSTGDITPDRATAALSAHQERERLRPTIEAEVEAIKAECTTTLASRPSLWSVAAGSGQGAAAGIAVIEALRERMPRDEVAAFVASIPALTSAGEPSNDLRLNDLEWADQWTHLEIWTDPCFVPFAAEGGNHLGLLIHPVLERGAVLDGDDASAAESTEASSSSSTSPPVVFRFHDHDPVFAWVAESADHFVRMIEAASRGDDVESLRGEQHEVVATLIEATQREEAFEDLERKDVHALFWSGAPVLEAAAAERLLARYRERNWSFAQTSTEIQIALAGWQARIDAAWAKLK